MIDVSVIIVNYNTRELLCDCISSIYTYTKNISFEIIVVDNNSGDGSVNVIAHSYPQVQIIPLKENIGFGRANNIGVQRACGKYLFFLNSDTVLLNDALSICYDYMEKNPQVGICGGNLYTEDLSPNMSYSAFPSLLTEILLMIGIKYSCEIDNLFNMTGNNKAIAGYVSGADMFVRRCLFEGNVFDPDFFMYYEDVELSYRIKKRGYEIHSVPEAKIIHLQGMSTKRNNESTQIYLIQSKLLYFNKTSFFFFLLYLSYFIKSVMAIIYFSLFKSNSKKEFWQRIMNVILQI